MLSANYTLSDVVAELENDYSYFDFVSNAAFLKGLERVSEHIMRSYFYPNIGQTEYETIQDKNKISLTQWEEYLYWAEVFTICYEFIKWREAKKDTLASDSDESLTVEGYSYKTSGRSGSGGGNEALKFYRTRMYEYWMNAGYNISAIARTCTIFGDIDPDTEDIILQT